MAEINTSYSETIKDLRRAFASGKTRNVNFRKQQLKNLLRLYSENVEAICSALKQDLAKPRQESELLEINVLKDDIVYMLNNIDDWVKPEIVSKNIVTIFDSPIIYHDPYGVVLVLGAWNYPLQLAMLPVSGAIAAGNCVVIKPSELSPATSNLLAKLIPKYLDKECFRVVEGDVKLTTELLKEKFDYIFFTGSPVVGKIVREAANKHLTPTTLELGGKSPLYIDDSVDFDVAVRRILWGKFINAGQTCIAPDYILCSKDVQDKFVAKSREVIREFYSENPKKSPDFCRIINERHTQRIAEYIKDGTVEIGGEVDISERYIAPTILTSVEPNSKVLSEEIFGPVLPIVTVGSAEEAIKYINERQKPLVTYFFSNKQAKLDMLLKCTTAGGSCVNDVILHLTVPGLPFGGVGNSGMGNYHGKASYSTFTHRKSCLHRDYNKIADFIGSKRYPPYSESKVAFLSNMLKERWLPSLKYVPHLLCFGIGVAATLIVSYARKATED